MTYSYKTKGTCSTQIDLELDGNVVHNVKFTGGCNGNLQAIPKLVEGLTVEQVEEKIGGIRCGGRPTSCGDQLAKAPGTAPLLRFLSRRCSHGTCSPICRRCWQSWNRSGKPQGVSV